MRCSGLRRRRRPLDHRHPYALRSHRGSGGRGGRKIYVVGGFGGERELEIYDTATDRRSRGAAIPRALHHAAAVGWQDKLYVVGGFVEGWTPTDDVHEVRRTTAGGGSRLYPLRAARWRPLCSMARSTPSAASAG